MGRAADEERLLLEPYQVLEVLPMLARINAAPTRPRLASGPATTLATSGPTRACFARRRIRRIMFAVEDIEDVLARLHAHGAELVGELEQYEDRYRLCYVRGPEGIIVALAEQFS
jgi:catechol 2,3-dioxygenase-like lactoylglutathione lyase family enzyme